MAESGIPESWLTAVRIAVFWIALPFIFLLVGVERFFDQHGNRYEVAACIVLAFLSILVAVYWDKLLPSRMQSEPKRLEYLHNEDSELGSAIMMMGLRSAWAKWYASQYLAADNHQPTSEHHVMQIATSLVIDALVDGKLEARGRKPGQLDYEPIPRTHWRSSVPHMVSNNRSLWKMILIPTGGAELNREGVLVRADDSAAKNRTDQLASYDSIIVSGREFESLWPRKDKVADKAKRRLLKKAKKAGANPTEIQKLLQD